MDAVEPTGSLVVGDRGPELIIPRTFAHAPEEVWAYLTESDRLTQWYGSWTGNPAEGTVQLTMQEAPDSPGECRIRRCEPGRALSVSLSDPDGNDWELELTLMPEGDATQVTLRQPLAGFAAAAPEVGPGWEYYLDRLGAALDGRPVDEIDFNSYYPHQAEHYRS